jgi:hypothetical protein
VRKGDDKHQVIATCGKKAPESKRESPGLQEWDACKLSAWQKFPRRFSVFSFIAALQLTMPFDSQR